MVGQDDSRGLSGSCVWRRAMSAVLPAGWECMEFIVVDAVMTPGYIWERVFWSSVPAGGPANQSSEDRDGSYLGGVLQEAHAVSESTAYEAVSCASSICVLETSYRTIVENFERLLSQPLGQAN